MVITTRCGFQHACEIIDHPNALLCRRPGNATTGEFSVVYMDVGPVLRGLDNVQ